MNAPPEIIEKARLWAEDCVDDLSLWHDCDPADLVKWFVAAFQGDPMPKEGDDS
jgi:hypothetical protein